MKNLAAPVAIVALLLSVTPAMAVEAPVKVEPNNIPALSDKTAPKPSLSDKLLAPFKGNEAQPNTPDPAKPLQVKKAADPGEMAPINAAPKKFEETKAPEPQIKPDLDAPKQVDLERLKAGLPQKPSEPAKLNTATVKDAKKDAAATKEAVKEAVEAPAPAAAEEKPAEKSGVSKYLPW